MNVMKILDFKRARIDPCLLSRMDERGTVLVVVYVDEICLIGDKDAINAAINDIETEFTIKKVGTLKEYIGVTVEHKTDEIHLTIGYN
jgi:Reverse transcriptase (RNA-dependent DNA polymerase)